MEKKVIDLRDCKEKVEIILPLSGSGKMDTCQVIDKDGCHIFAYPKDSFDLVPKRLSDLNDNEHYCFINNFGEIQDSSTDINESFSFWFKTNEDAEAFFALIHLRLLWHKWIEVLGKFIPADKYDSGWGIIKYDNTIECDVVDSGMFVFKEKSHAEKFIECFSDLLEKAKIFL